MNRRLLPVHLVAVSLAGWLNKHQQRAIDYLREENRVLREQIGKKRLRLTDDQRRRLAAKGKPLGRKLLGSLVSIVTPETILAWHRKLIALKWTFNVTGGPGRPRKSRDIEELVVRLARENPTWGYDKIQGAVENLGYDISSTTVAAILKRIGIVPAPERGRTASWRTSLKAHWDSIAACDFYTTEVWTPRGLVTFYTFFVIHLATRRVEIAGTTPHPDGIFMAQIAKNLTDPIDGFLTDMRFLIRDNDGKFSGGFDGILQDEGIDIVRTPYRAPNANAYAERFVRTIKYECLNRMIFFGVAALRRAQSEFLAHYNRERNHQGIANQIIEPGDEVGATTGSIACRQRLGGMLRYYRRAA